MHLPALDFTKRAILSLSLSDAHKALLLKCQLTDIEAVLMIDAPDKEVAKMLLSLSQEWIRAGSPYQIFYIYVDGTLTGEVSLSRVNQL
ncbi:hypothetical protein NDI52_29705 [Leptolyngbya sp. PL-A3]|uniref:hypothetical protein n=1 Tax=Leptolyngbya sp. PL-A3 TaxID=2933911 RepID=UPI0032972B68